MALGFYDRVVELFKELQQESPDPILEYDLAVSTFHLLRFEEAAEHLQAYTQYFPSRTRPPIRRMTCVSS